MIGICLTNALCKVQEQNHRDQVRRQDTCKDLVRRAHDCDSVIVLIVRVTHRHEGSGLPELGQGSRLKATGTAYGSTRACDELTTAIACVDSRREGLPLALSKARVAQGTW